MCCGKPVSEPGQLQTDHSKRTHSMLIRQLRLLTIPITGKATVSIFGEWERLPVDGIFLQPGDYIAELILTEESFHGSGGTFAGNWAAAMGTDIEFSVIQDALVIEAEDASIKTAGGINRRQLVSLVKRDIGRICRYPGGRNL